MVFHFYPTRPLLPYEYDMKSGPCLLDKYNTVGLNRHGFTALTQCGRCTLQCATTLRQREIGHWKYVEKK
ncbi:hypothetical protein P8452_28434 [Trifolium repens]|nr:hypothetical protein P8452_28434 [Trifolium repens]